MPITHDPESESFLTFDHLTSLHRAMVQEILTVDLDYEDFQEFADAHSQARQALYHAVEVGRGILAKHGRKSV